MNLEELTKALNEIDKIKDILISLMHCKQQIERYKRCIEVLKNDNKRYDRLQKFLEDKQKKEKELEEEYNFLLKKMVDN